MMTWHYSTTKGLPLMCAEPLQILEDDLEVVKMDGVEPHPQGE